MLRRILFVGLLVFALHPTRLVAQRPTGSPEAAARASLWAMAHSDFQYLARHTEPGGLRGIRVGFDSLLRTDSSNYIAMRLFRMDSTARVRRLDDVDFAAGLMVFAFGINPSFRQLATIVDIDIPGAVHRGADTAFVVYRWVYPKDSLQTAVYNVERMTRCPVGWCTQVPGTLGGILQLLKEPMVSAPVHVGRPPLH